MLKETFGASAIIGAYAYPVIAGGILASALGVMVLDEFLDELGR